jgi:Right handed beta helix region
VSFKERPFAALANAGSLGCIIDVRPDEAVDQSRRRRWIFLIALSAGLLASSCGATDYFVATNGLDSNPGTDLGHPFLTLAKAASMAGAGDTVNIRGGTYRETVTLVRSGTTSSPIIFQSYSNEIVTVDGADVIPTNAWTLYSGAIWQATLPWTLGAGADQVFVDGQMMNEARWPNSSLDQSHPSVAVVDSVSIPDVSNAVVTLNDSALTQPAGFWNGARLNMGIGKVWVSKTYTVTNNSPGQLTFYAGNTGNANYRPAAGNPYYLWGTLNALDTAGEWFNDTAANRLYLWTPAGDSPAGHVVEAKHRVYAFDLNSRSNIVLRGLRFFAATVTMSSASRNNTLDGIEARYLSHFTVITSPFTTGNTDTGLLMNGTGHRVLNSIIGWSAGNGIMLSGNGHTVSNCIVHDVDYVANDCGAVSPQGGTGDVITHNTFYNSGRSLLLHRHLQAGKLLYNHIYNAGLQMQDLGCTYAYATDGAGTEIAYNVVHGCHPIYGSKIGVGIYIDNNSPNHLIHHNVAYDCDRAMILNLPGTNELVYNNTLLGDKYTITGGGSPNDATGTVIENNIFRNSVSAGAGATLLNNLASSTDPLFVDATNADFQLQPGSPAIDTGLLIPPYTDGYAGAAPDLGALESGAVPWHAGSSLTLGGFYDVDIGGVKPGGYLDYWDGTYTLDGGGNDIWGNADQFHFAYLPVTNTHVQVIARVTALEPVYAWTKCGVMIRDALTEAAMHAMTVITPSNGVNFMYRTSTTNTTSYVQITGKTVPLYLKLVRSGNNFSSWYSTNGTAWSQIGTAQTIAMSNAVYAGLCLSSHVVGTVAAATLDHVIVEPLAAPSFGAVTPTNGRIRLRIDGDVGPGYAVQASTNLADWATVFTTNPPALPFDWIDGPGSGLPARFYRVVLTP